MRIVQVVMCGGAGTRLWPVSRKTAPKQLHALVGESSLLAQTIARGAHAEGLDRNDTILIANAALAEGCVQALKDAGAPGGRIVLEPSGKNTAPAAALASLAALERDPAAIVLLLPADHYIGDLDAYAAGIARGAALAAEGWFVTFGIRPTEANTGYGYIARGEPIAHGGFAVARFVEKPPLKAAQAMASDPAFSWNSGIFMARADRLLEELARHEPAALDGPRKAFAEAERSGPFIRLEPQAWATTKAISLDYAVAERTDRAAVAPVDMAWSDVGSWSTLWEISPKDEAGNVAIGDATAIDSRNVYVRAGSGRRVAVVGLEDVVVIETADAVLVLPRARSQDVKLVVERLAGEGRTDLL